MATFSSIKDKIPFYRILLILLIIKAALIRFSLADVAYIDADFAGYVNPAIEWLEKGFFHLQSARNAVYPLFAAGCLAVSGTVNTIVFVQHLLALVGILLLGLSLPKLFEDDKTVLSKVLSLVCLFLLSQNNDLIRMEHTLRPEGLILFITGLVTWLMLRLQGQRSPTVSYSLLLLTLGGSYLLLPKLMLGFIFLFVIASLLYLKIENYNKRVIIKAGAICILPLVIIGLNYTLIYGNVERREFVARNFFYANARMICDCAETHGQLYSPVEKQHLFELKTQLQYSAGYSILGYDPDPYQYGPEGAKLDSILGSGKNDFYNGIMNKTLLRCPEFFWKKGKQQLVPYFFSVNGTIRIPHQQSIDQPGALSISYELRNTPEIVESPLLQDYIYQVEEYRNRGYYDNSSFFVYKMFGGKPLQYLSVLVFILLCLRLPFHVYKPFERIDKLDVLLITWVLFLVPVALIHTFDNARYWISIYPIIPLIVALSLYRLFHLPYTFVRDRFKSLDGPVKVLVAVIGLMLGYYGLNKVYDFNRYHLFDPFLQIHPPVFAVPQQKEPGEIRILCLGGSTTASLTLSEPERYPAVLQMKLQAAFPGKKITVLNGGMDWYTAKHSAMYYISYCRNFKPDVVIVLHGINDLYRSFSPEGYAYGAYKEDYSHFYGPSINGANPPSFEKYIILSAFGDFINSRSTRLEKNYPIERYLAQPAFSAYMKNLVEVVENDGAQCYVLTQPALYKERNSPEEARKCWFHIGFCATKIRTGKFEYPSLSSMKHALDAFNQSQIQVALQANATVINADSLLPKTLEYFTDDVHYTAKGASTMADIVFEAVRRDSVFTADTTPISVQP